MFIALLVAIQFSTLIAQYHIAWDIFIFEDGSLQFRIATLGWQMLTKMSIAGD
jgi:hypothetical protein